LNSTVPGRYDFDVRSGQLVTNTPEPFSIGFCAVGLAAIFIKKKVFARRGGSRI